MSLTDKALKVVAERPMPVVSPPAAPAAPPAVFSADSLLIASESQPYAAFLADLALHQATATPLCIGIFGPAGVGKSSLLRATQHHVEMLGRSATEAGIATPFVAGAATLQISVEPGRDPFAALLRQASVALASHYPETVAEAAQAFDDPQAAARDADDRLSTARHRLDEERRRLDELTARQSRLLETVLFDGAGSRVDAYTRANRGRIDRALRRFGFVGDTALIYKELVRDAAESGLGRGLGWLSAFWAYRGQLRLILVALAFFGAAWLMGSLLAHQDGLIDALRASNDKMGPAADWLGAHAAWLQPMRQLLEIAGCAALAMNIGRAVRFVQPITRGATLLRGDLDGRRRDLDGLVAHQAQRVEATARDVEQASGRAAEAERRLGTGPQATLPVTIRGDIGPAAAAQSFFASLSDAIAARTPRRGADRTPARLVVSVDGFERVPPVAAAAFLDAVHVCFARPGIVTVMAADRDALAAGLAETDPALARATLDRIVQIPIHLGHGADVPWPAARLLAQSMLRPAGPESEAVDTEVDAGRSAFERAWLPKEAAVIEALAPFAGTTPRALKRYINLYRVARADPALRESGAAELAALALGLALGGTGALPPAALLAGGSPLGGELQAARHAASTALGVALDLGRESRGLDVARRYVGA